MPRLLATARDTVRTQLWPLPVVGVLVAAVCGVLLPRFDAYADDSIPAWLDGVLFGGDADAARTVLAAVSSSLITVTSLTFSLTVVTLQLASSQFSPRLLRTFTSDVFVQATLGLFLATFTYSLTVLRAVRSSRNSAGAAFVPKMSVTLSFILAIASVIGLVVFLAHLARQIRVETMLRDVHQDAMATVRAVLKHRDDAGPQQTLPPVGEDAVDLLCPASGFLVRIDERDLFAAASTASVIIVVTARPGMFLVERTPLGQMWSPDGPIAAAVADKLQRRVAAAVHIGSERTAAQDVGYGLRQLTDVTNKALSPGINDPTTAVHALGHISSLLCELLDRDLSPVVLFDDGKQVRVVVHQPGVAEMVDIAITQPRRYGAADPQVMAAMFTLLADLARRAHPEQTHIVVRQLARLRKTVSAQDFDATESAQLASAAREVDNILSRHATAPD